MCTASPPAFTKRGNASLLAGSTMRYDLTIANTSNVNLEIFFWHDRIPTDVARATVLTAGTYSALFAAAGCPNPDANIIPGQAKNNLDFRVCGRADSILSGIILDDTSPAKQIPKDARGRFILQDGTIFQGYLFDEGQL